MTTPREPAERKYSDAEIEEVASGMESPQGYVGELDPCDMLRSLLASRQSTPDKAGVSDADVRGACRAFYGERWLRMEQDQPMRWMRAALTHFAQQSAEAARDGERYRWLKENVQPWRNGNPSPHAVVKISLGIRDGKESAFDLIDKTPHVGVVSLDQAIDAALKEQGHD